MITKCISTLQGDCVTTAEISHSDNGQVVLKVVSKLGDAEHTHTTTIGAEDGKDLVASLSENELKNHLQSHLDRVRAHAADVLAGRAKVSKIAAELI